MINTLCHADIIEYGSSPRYGWLTNKGTALKVFVDGRSSEDLCKLTSRDASYIPCGPGYCNCDDNATGPQCPNPFWTTT